MFDHKAKVLLILPQEVVDRARALAGRMTTLLKIPVSLQIVLRALIQEGLKRENDHGLHGHIAGQAQAVRRIRSLAARGGTVPERRPGRRAGLPQERGGRGQRRTP